ncbi:MAG: Holliday junction branch migration protein RuvA [Candidatus Magasanikbacteria bacterium]
MIHNIEGKVEEKTEDYVVIKTGSFGFKVLTHESAVRSMPPIGEEVKMFSFLYVRETDLELYGFLEKKTRHLFDMLIGVSGIGPKTALGLLDLDEPERIMSAIVEKKSDFLTGASGIGEKTAERLILELHNELSLSGAEDVAETIDVDKDLREALISLGYNKKEAKEAIGELGKEPQGFEPRLKEALKIISSK